MTMINADQIEKALALIESGCSEREACRQVGISRPGFRGAVLRYKAADRYARATEALARDQVNKIEDAIEELREGKITPEVARIEIDARKWLASRLFRPAWSNKEVQRQGGEQPTQVVFNTVLEPIPEWAEQRMREIEQNGGEWSKKEHSSQ